uniref:long-chain-fatty-acid--CoA ligase n=1 Tax=Syphacia muris TaxID=451379 RepID=A0A0N5ALY4_9BILA
MCKDETNFERAEEKEKFQKTVDKLVKGRSPLWIQIIIFLIKSWFYIYDCINYIPYKLFSPPKEKLRKSARLKARSMGSSRGPWRNVLGVHNETFPGANTVDKLFAHVTEIYGDKTMLGTREVLDVSEEMQEDGRVFDKWLMGEYHWQTFKEVHKRVGYIAAGLKNIAGSDSKLVIFAETRADWLITAFSCFRANIVIVTVYATLGEEGIIRAINDTNAKIIVTSAELLPKLSKVVTSCPTLQSLIYFPVRHSSIKLQNLDVFRPQFKHILSLNDLEHSVEKPIEKSSAAPSDLALIMYTSGTTGIPKGVMMTNENIVASLAGTRLGVEVVTEKDTMISFLPLAHIYELITEMVCLVRGTRLGYSSTLTFHDRGTKVMQGGRGDCWALKPTLMAGVPVIWDKIFKAVSEEIAQTPRLIQELFKLNYERKRTRFESGYCSPFLDRIVFKKIRRLLGGRIKAVISGGATLNAETHRFLNICICPTVLQGYGLTEICAAGAISDRYDLSTGSVGPPLACSQFLLEEWEEGGYFPDNDPPQGEILVGGRNVSIGYWNQPEKTAESFVEIDGIRYFRTGDIGQIRDDGSLMIIDRKKDLVKLRDGEYIAMGKVEVALSTSSLVDGICVYGDSFEIFLVALVVPNKANLEKLALEIGEPIDNWDQLCHNSNVVNEFASRLQQHAVKNKLMKKEIPKKVFLCAEIWTPESGLLTEAMKVRRTPLTRKYSAVIDEMYDRTGITKA